MCGVNCVLSCCVIVWYGDVCVMVWFGLCMIVELLLSDGDVCLMKVVVDDDVCEDVKDAMMWDDLCCSGVLMMDDVFVVFVYDEFDCVKMMIVWLWLEKYVFVMGNKWEGEVRVRVEVEARARAEVEAKALAAERGVLIECEWVLWVFVEDKKVYDEVLCWVREECVWLMVVLELEWVDMERAFAARTGAMRVECDARVVKVKK